MKANRTTKPTAKPRGTIYGCRWSEVPVSARVCLVTVGMAPKNWWCHDIVGEERSAVEVVLNKQTVYVDNKDGRALQAFLKGYAPLPGFRFMPAFFVKDHPDAPMAYQAQF
jgi:hypothetical protein